MLWDHVVQDRVILPGTAFMELAHAAAHTLLGGEGSGSASVANASLVTPLVLQHTEPSAVRGQVVVQVLASGAVRLASPAGTLHVAGHLAALAPASLRPRPAGGRRWAGRQPRGPRQGLTALVGGSAAQASQRGFSVDPAAMDNAVHLYLTESAAPPYKNISRGQTFVPAAVGAYCPQRALRGASGPLTAAARALPAWPAGGGAKVSSHWLLTAAGEAHAHLSRLQSRALRPAPPGPAGAAAREGGAAGAAGVAGAAGGSLLYGSCWRASTPPPAGGTAPGPPSARAARAPVAVRWGGPPGENAGRALALALSVPPARPAEGGTQAGLLGLVLGAHRGLLQALQPALRVSPELVVRACSPGPSGAWGAEPGGGGHAGAGAAGAHAALLAFLKTLEAEAPRLRWQAVGTDPRDAAGPLAPWPAPPPPGAAGVGAVAAEGRATSSAASRRALMELIVAKRGEHAVRSQATRQMEATWHISGGLGALGALAAAWLANGGASSLVLLGRTGHSRAVQQDHPAHLKQPLSAGLVHTVRCDMSSSEETCEALGRGAFAGARGRPGASSAQRGVLHAGGVLRDATLPNQTVAGARAVTGPKVAGLHHILAACAGMPVQALKLFSSVAAFLGSPGQLNYSTANAQLDAAAGELYRQGLAGVSVQWGPWGGGGMAQASRATEQRMERMGLHMLDAQ